MLINLLIFAASCILLVESSTFLLKSLVKISSFLKLNEFTVGFIIMSVSTSLPELLVGVISAFNKDSVLPLGTAIGSNIVDLTVVIGIVTVLANGIKIQSKTVKRDMLFMLLCILAPIVLMIDHLLWEKMGIIVPSGISRLDGVILLGIFVFYVWRIVEQEKRFKRSIERTSSHEAMKHIVYVILLLILLLVSAEFTVRYANLISLEIGISKLLIGLFLVAVGTSLPELAFETKAVLARHQDMAIGDLIGSVVANSTLVIGLTAVINPIQTDFLIFFTSILFMLLISVIFVTFAESDNQLSWKEGTSMLFLYILFVVIELYIKSLR